MSSIALFLISSKSVEKFESYHLEAELESRES